MLGPNTQGNDPLDFTTPTQMDPRTEETPAAGGLSMEPPSPDAGGLTIGSTGPSVPPDAIPGRAAKYHVAMGSISPGPDTIASTLANGDESSLRDAQMQNEELKFKQAKANAVSSMIANSPNGVSDDDAQFVMGMTKTDFKEVASAKTIMETSYAKKFVQSIVTRDENQNFSRTEAISPETANQVLDVGEYGVAKNEIALRWLDSIHQDQKSQSWLSSTADFVGANILPLASVRLMNLVQSPSVTSLLPGSNMQEQLDYLHTLEPNQLEDTFNKILPTISNLSLREQFVTAFLQQSDSTAGLTNLGAAADLGTLAEAGAKIGAGVGSAIAKAGLRETTAGLVSTVRSAVTASKDAVPDLEKIAATTGDFRTGAIAQALKLADRDITVTGEDAVRRNAFSLNNGSRWYSGDPANFSGPSAREFMDMAQHNTELASDFLHEAPTIDRTSPEERYANYGAKYDAFVHGNLKDISGAVLDIDSKRNPVPKSGLDAVEGDTTKFVVTPSDLTNTEQMSIAIGRKNGEFFPNKASAVKFFQDNFPQYQMRDENIVPYAGKYHIQIHLDVPDTVSNLRDITIPVNDKFDTGFFNNGLFNGFFGKFRNRSEVLGNANMDARRAVVHGNQKLFETLQEMSKPLAALNPEERKKLGVILENNRNTVDRFTDPDKPTRGRFFENRGAFEEAYNTRWGHLPSDKETQAYYAYVQMNHFDGMIRNASWYKDKVRVGGKEYTDHIVYDRDISNNVPGATLSKKDKMAATTQPITLEGKKVPSIPFGDGNRTQIAIRDSQTGRIRFVSKEFATEADKKMIADELNGGGRIIQALDGHFKLPGADGDKVVSHYVTGSAKEGQLSMNGPWQDGGHVVYEHSHYIKQPKIVDGWYHGDNAIATAPNAKIARERAAAYEEARVKMLRGDADLDQFVSEKIGNGMDGKTFKAMFDRDPVPIFEHNLVGDSTATRTGLDPNSPIVWTQRGERTIDRHKMDYVKQGQNPYDLIEQDRKFAGERGIETIPAMIEEKGVRQIHEDGKLIDPFNVMTQAAKALVDARLNREYIIKSSLQFVRQFKDILQGDPQSLEVNYLRTLYEPKFLPNADSQLVNAAQNVRSSIIRFAGTQTPDTSRAALTTNKLRELAYGVGGDRNILDSHLLPFSKNIPQVAKGIAFHLKIGLFSPSQFFMQGQSLANVMAIAPGAALKGVPAYFPMRAAMLNPNMLDHSAGIVSKYFGWKAQDFKDCYQALMRSGWTITKGDQAILDDIANPNLFKSKGGKVLDAGTVFASEGVKIHRISAFTTAFQEWRAANPGAALTRQVEQNLVSRADTMTQYMSAANNAGWQRGFASIPSQFLTYQMRLMDSYVGKTLTPMEKVRLFGMNAALYGFPMAVGGAVGVWPVADSLREYLVDNNIPHDEGVLGTVIHGIPQMLLKAATGNSFEVGERFGMGGWSLPRELWKGDKTVWDAVIGASGSVISEALQTTMPFIKALNSAGSVDPKDDIYPMDVQTIERVAGNATSIGSAIKVWHALETGEWMNKYGQPADKVTPFQAVFMGITEAKTSNLSDYMAVQEAARDRKSQSVAATKDVMDYYRRALNEEDPIQRAEYMRIAKAHAVLGGLTAQEMLQAMRQTLASSSGTLYENGTRRLNLDAMKRSTMQEMNTEDNN